MTKKVLLVEDEPHIVEALTFILGREGLTVETLDNGTEVIDRLSQDPVDLVILDYMLPELSGLEILTRIREHPNLAELPVLMLTAKGQTKDREAAESAGVSRFMTKPFANSEIVQTAKELLG
ncbi:MAG: response regulator [Pseudomonadota bacterium]